MEWEDEGIVLAATPHGETAAIVTLLTATHGRHAGLVHGGQSARKKAWLQPGTEVSVQWQARLLDQLGSFTLEPLETRAAPWLDNPEILGLLASACALTAAALPERQPMPGIYAGLKMLLSLPDATLWAPVYIKWELGLLQALGYGLDLSCCALSGETEGLAFISPKTGRAATNEAAGRHKDKLLRLPPFLAGGHAPTAQDILDGLELTGYFLSRRVFINPHSDATKAFALPPARERLTAFYRVLSEQEMR